MTGPPPGARRFARIDRLPPYVFNVTAELKLGARRAGEDIIDMSMGNPDGPTPTRGKLWPLVIPVEALAAFNDH